MTQLSANPLRPLRLRGFHWLFLVLNKPVKFGPPDLALLIAWNANENRGVAEDAEGSQRVGLLAESVSSLSS